MVVVLCLLSPLSLAYHLGRRAPRYLFGLVLGLSNDMINKLKYIYTVYVYIYLFLTLSVLVTSEVE